MAINMRHVLLALSLLCGTAQAAGAYRQRLPQDEFM